MRKVSYLEIYDVEKKTRTLLHTFDGVIEAPNWLADGHSFLYNADGRLFVYDMNDDSIRQITITGQKEDRMMCNNDHVLSPDNGKIGFSADPGSDDPDAKEVWKSYVYEVPAEGGSPVQITEISPSYLHGWSHDGKMLCYCAFRDSKVDICVIPAEGGQEKCLTDGRGYNDGPEYSPDDQYIWFNSTRSGLMQAFRMKADGSQLTQMTDSEANNWFPHISPDGKKVVYLAFRKGDLEPWQHVPDKQVSLWLMDSDGSNKEEIVRLFGGQGTINVNSWSPDSGRFAFISYEYLDE